MSAQGLRDGGRYFVSAQSAKEVEFGIDVEPLRPRGQRDLKIELFAGHQDGRLERALPSFHGHGKGDPKRICLAGLGLLDRGRKDKAVLLASYSRISYDELRRAGALDTLPEFPPQVPPGDG